MGGSKIDRWTKNINEEGSDLLLCICIYLWPWGWPSCGKWEREENGEMPEPSTYPSPSLLCLHNPISFLEHLGSLPITYPISSKYCFLSLSSPSSPLFLQLSTHIMFFEKPYCQLSCHLEQLFWSQLTVLWSFDLWKILSTPCTRSSRVSIVFLSPWNSSDQYGSCP